MKYLIENGHAKIMHFPGPPNSTHIQERIEGFRHAFSESPLIYNKKMIVSIGSNYDESYKNSLEFLKNMNKADYPTAIVCFNDQQALAVMTVLMELNIKVPDDISIIGIDDIYYAKNYHVPLTTICAPLHEIGKKAAEILIKNIESSTILPMERVVLDTEFIVRKSSKVLNT